MAAVTGGLQQDLQWMVSTAAGTIVHTSHSVPLSTPHIHHHCPHLTFNTSHIQYITHYTSAPVSPRHISAQPRH